MATQVFYYYLDYITYAYIGTIFLAGQKLALMGVSIPYILKRLENNKNN